VLARYRTHLPIYAVALSAVGLIIAEVIYHRDVNCPLSPTIFQVSSVAMTASLIGVLIAVFGAFSQRKARAWLVLGAGVLISGHTFLLLMAVGIGCSGI